MLGLTACDAAVAHLVRHYQNRGAGLWCSNADGKDSSAESRLSPSERVQEGLHVCQGFAQMLLWLEAHGCHLAQYSVYASLHHIAH